MVSFSSTLLTVEHTGFWINEKVFLFVTEWAVTYILIAKIRCWVEVDTVEVIKV
jgi:hypothetical protein